MLFTNKSKGTTGTQDNMGESKSHYAKRKNSDTQKKHALWFHSYETPGKKKTQPIVTEVKSVVAWGQG